MCPDRGLRTCPGTAALGRVHSVQEKPVTFLMRSSVDFLRAGSSTLCAHVRHHGGSASTPAPRFRVLSADSSHEFGMGARVFHAGGFSFGLWFPPGARPADRPVDGPGGGPAR